MISSTVGQMPLSAFVEAVNRVYSGKDVKRSIWDVWMHANHHASGIAEEVRRSTSGLGLLRELQQVGVKNDSALAR